MSHTPGPWVVVNDTAIAPAWAINERVAKTIAVNLRENEDGSFPEYGECQKADTHLIAAAPDLLDAVEELLIYLADWDDPDNETCQRARAAVAKAKGGRL